MNGAKRIGVNCKFMGLWLLATSAILVYGETAPSVEDPELVPALIVLVLGIAVFYSGCFFCRRSG